MDRIAEELINQLPKPDIELTESNLKKIKKLMPVPNDYKILWADMISFGGYPAGLVITDRGLVIKATKDVVKNKNQEISEKNKKSEKKEKESKIKFLYQIIPWEYYSPEEYDIKIENDDKGKKRYFFVAGDGEFAEFRNDKLYEFFEKYKKKVIDEKKKEAEIIENSTTSAINSLNVKETMFNATYGSDNTKTGHGIYAEEAGAKLDKLYGEHSSVVGRDNAKNGPDKIVNSSPVQCKYCKSARNTVNACFVKDSTGTKTFRYYDLNGNPMLVEVPSDQYSSAIEYMKQNIIDGNVPGVTDPNKAYDIIRRGKISYKQALNLAKAGTIESITFDVASGAVNCLSALGISCLFTFAQTVWSTKDYKLAAKSALLVGIQVYGLSIAGGVIASQIARTGITDVLKPTVAGVVNKMSPKLLQEILNSFRRLAGKNAIYGAAAQKSFVKFLSSNAVTQGIFFVVFALPDTYRIIAGKLSGSQYTKNMLSLIASFAGSIGGAIASGSILGATVGSVATPVGTAVGLAGGTIGGLVMGLGTKGLTDLVREDDAIITTRMFNAVLTILLIEYMLTEDEIDKLVKSLDEDKKNLKKLQSLLPKSPSQSSDIEKYLRPKIEKIVNERLKITAKEETKLYENINEELISGGLENEL